MSGFFRRFFSGDKGSPPPPDVTDQPLCPSSQSIVEILYSDSKSKRAVITVDETGDYRIIAQWWDTSDWESGYGRALWYGDNIGSHSDTIERARERANEILRGSKCDA